MRDERKTDNVHSHTSGDGVLVGTTHHHHHHHNCVCLHWKKLKSFPFAQFLALPHRQQVWLPQLPTKKVRQLTFRSSTERKLNIAMPSTISSSINASPSSVAVFFVGVHFEVAGDDDGAFVVAIVTFEFGDGETVVVVVGDRNSAPSTVAPRDTSSSSPMIISDAISFGSSSVTIGGAQLHSSVVVSFIGTCQQ
jgi:hypothetical protein